MSEPLWLTERGVIALHQEQLSRFGGPTGLRDPGLLTSALDRPRNKWAYEEADLIACAAAYAYGLAKNHPFVDGNKRIAFLAMALFLEKNGIRFECGQAEVVTAIIDLAAGKVDEDGLARWIRDVIEGRAG
jgi:death-on-curing protein